MKRLKKWWCVEHEKMYDYYREVLAKLAGAEQDIAFLERDFEEQEKRLVEMEQAVAVLITKVLGMERKRGVGVSRKAKVRK
jgi:hypothetical protein